jgi:hypothetical protein
LERVLDDRKAELENGPIESVTESLGGYLVAIRVCWIGEFARGRLYLAPCFELSIARLKECVPEMALLDDSIPIADQLLPNFYTLLTRLLVPQSRDGNRGGYLPRESIEQPCIAPAEVLDLYVWVTLMDIHRFLQDPSDTLTDKI